MKLVLVEWKDSATCTGWHILNDKDDNISHCVSVGILCLENKERISLALSKSDSGNYGDVMSIPKSCIKRLRILRVS